MLEKLKSIIEEYNSYQNQLYDNDIFADQTRLTMVNRKLKSMDNIYQLANTYVGLNDTIKEAKDILSHEKDQDMLDLAKSELQEAQNKMSSIEEEIKLELLPKDPNDDKDVFLEIRPAAGGDEAGLFASELLKAYLLYAQSQGRKTEVVEEQYSDIGGVKLIIMKIVGDNVYSKLKRESGVHRVQRIPDTESNGRVHTSTITVAIMPEIDDVTVHIDPADVEMDTYAASSAGGQNANKNQTGVRLRHKATGLMVTIGDSKSQIHNKEKAFAVLRSRLYQIEMEKQQAEVKDIRGSQIGTGSRSEKIRTYNYPQDRVTDHRIKKSWSNLPSIMMGNMQDIFDSLVVASRDGSMGIGEDDD